MVIFWLSNFGKISFNGFCWSPAMETKDQNQMPQKERNFQFKSKLSFISSSLAFNAILCGPMRLNFCHVPRNYKNRVGRGLGGRGIRTSFAFSFHMCMHGCRYLCSAGGWCCCFFAPYVLWIYKIDFCRHELIFILCFSVSPTRFSLILARRRGSSCSGSCACSWNFAPLTFYVNFLKYLWKCSRLWLATATKWRQTSKYIYISTHESSFLSHSHGLLARLLLGQRWGRVLWVWMCHLRAHRQSETSA